MNKKIKQYTENNDLGNLKVVKDFLPSSEVLARADEIVKVTIGLSRRSVNYFKREAKRHNASYQKMIRRLVDMYVIAH